MNKITVSAPGKLMLLGEHAVVYGHPCIVTAVDQRMRETVEVINEPIFELHAPDVRLTDYRKSITKIGHGEIPKGVKFVEMAVKNSLELNSKFFLRHSGKRSDSRISYRSNQRDSGQARMTVGIRVTTKSELSPKLGLGSSAAVVVCTAKALSEILGINLSKKELFDVSYKTVLDIQGKGSGFDVAAAVYGGTLYFVTGGKIIEPLPINSLPLIVGYSGVKADTVTLINKVKDSFANRQNRLNEIYNRIEVLVNQAKDALVKMDWQKLGELMNKNQDLLVEVGVSIDKLDDMIKASLSQGAYGAKLSGAGGGDCMIALHSAAGKLSVQEAIKKAGGEVINVKTNAEGVRVE